MRSIEARFYRERQRQPNMGEFIQFASAISQQGFRKRTLTEAFYKLVPRSEYANAEKKELLAWLMKHTKK